jgi:molybdenum cofactor guanylyltransferase
MGHNKALLPFGGGVLAEAVARAVEQAAGSVALVGRPEEYSHLNLRAIPDCCLGQGPLAGIITALRDSRANWNLVAACDMPGLTAGFLAALLDEAETRDSTVLLPEGPGGWLEPVCAVYHRRALPALEAAFDRGERKAGAALADLPVTVYRCCLDTHFQNVNTPEDWAQYAK